MGTRRGFLGAAAGAVAAGLAGCSALRTHQAWTVGEDARWPVVAGETLYALFGDRVAAVDPHEKTVTWQGEVPATPVGPPAATSGGIAVPYGEGVAGFADGERRWTVEAPGEGWTRAVGGPGHVFVASEGGDGLHAIDAESGETEWQADLPGPAVGRPGFEKWTVYVPCSEGLRAVAHDGTERWTVPLSGVRAVRPHLDAVLVTSARGVHELGAERGAVRQSWYHPDTLRGPVVPDAWNLLVGSAEGKLFAVDLNWSLEWTYNATDGGEDVTVSPPVVVSKPGVDGDPRGRRRAVCRVTGGESEGAHAVERASGRRAWRVGVGGAEAGPPALVGDRTVVVAGENGLHGLAPWGRRVV